MDPSGCHVEGSRKMVSRACVGKSSCIVDTDDAELTAELTARCGFDAPVVAVVEAVCR